MNRSGNVASAATLAALLLLAAPPAAATIKDYPLRLAIEERDGQRQLVAHNEGDVPVTVHLPDGLPGAEDDEEDFTHVVEPRSQAVLADVADAPGEGLAYSFYVGRIDAEPRDAGCNRFSCASGRCYRMPYPDGRAFAISQAYGLRMVSHDNDQNRYAVDFAMPEGVPVLAARSGVVADATLEHDTGGADPSFIPRANRITIVHDDGTLARYVHLAPGAPLVRRGQRVEAGAVIGHSGNTGYTGDPHLHFVVARPGIVDGKVRPLSIPFCFYTGAPPRTFTPVTGMTAKADYGAAKPPAPSRKTKPSAPGVAQRPARTRAP